MTTLWEKWEKVFEGASPAEYDQVHGQGVPAAVVWREREIWPFDGRVHCSGAVWWALVEMLKKFTDLQEDAEMDNKMIEALRLAAWEDLDPDKRGDLPILLGELGLADYSNEPPQEGDICQVWRTNGTGHLIVCAGWEDGKMLEWSASKHNANGTGTRHFSGTPEQYFTARLKEEFFR